MELEAVSRYRWHAEFSHCTHVYTNDELLTILWMVFTLVCCVICFVHCGDHGVRRQAGEHALILHDLIVQLHEAGVDIKPNVFRRFRHWQRRGTHQRKWLEAFCLEWRLLYYHTLFCAFKRREQ